MLINCDVRGLEVVCAAQLSGDEVLCKEIINGEDIHGNNQVAFGLGEGKQGRGVAKVLKFRTIYGGGAYSFSVDPDFTIVSSSEKYWQDVLDKYFNKYYGLKQWHDQLLIEAQTTGRITIPSGRYFPITPDFKKRQPWPLPIIKNYPVSGFGADLVMLARLRASQLLRQANVEALMVSTVHDSIVVDTPSKNVEIVAKILFQAVQEVPAMVRNIWKYNFVLPLTSELQVGQNKLDMQPYVVV